MAIFALQNPLCARILLPETEKQAYYNKLRNPNLSYLFRKQLRKQIQAKAKKYSVCPHCGDINGAVKKCGLLKIVHEKYSNKKFDSVVQNLLSKIIFHL